MENLFIIWDNFSTQGTTGIVDNTLNAVFLLSVFFGIYVIASKNPIVSVLFLIALFLVVAFYLMQLDITFIGLSYILVYVGAVSILFLFILMLINVRVSELVTDNNNGIPLSLIVITVFSLVLNNSTSSSLGTEIKDKFFNSANINMSAFTSWDTSLSHTSHITSIGNVIYTSYPILLLTISVILLLAMIGAIIITLRSDN